MKYLSNRGLNHIEKIKVWGLWREGKTLSEIGLTVDRHAGSIFGVLKLKGGYHPCTENVELLLLRLSNTGNTFIVSKAQWGRKRVSDLNYF